MTVMNNPKFEDPIIVESGQPSSKVQLADINACSEFLLREWPGKRGDKHRAALQSCADVTAGKKPASHARKAFAAAAREAGLVINR
ncbi:DUF982 domain-containing protein [Arvimicrobium flavum]|uniref:DUF982 domain-containing protein n=1 Tax=Arvimicrobium flavum TaxID=3393320 RepID=UPI00237BD51B|nr:DUF982 domain-containing protein [Mesorhizobium shangrilense]